MIASLTGILIALDGGSVSFESNDLTDQLVPSNFDELVHFWSGHVLTDDHYQKNIKVNKLT